MIKLLKLYTLPVTFDPIVFKDGINLILGEKVEESKVSTKKDKKTNGVGKSMSVEFINFCLLKQTSNSRIMKIPIDIFPEDTKINLDLIIGETQITITRTKSEPDKPLITKDGKQTEFSNIDDALNYLNDLLYSQEQDLNIERPSFRQLLGPLLRDEDSEFKDVIHCFDLRKRIPSAELIKPHLYFFQIDLNILDKIKDMFKNIEDNSKFLNKLKRDLTLNRQKKISEVKAEANALNVEVEKINNALESFKTNEAYEAIQNDLIKIEGQINTLRTEQAALKHQINKIQSLPKLESISTDDVEIVYNQFKTGLGDSISKSLNQVMEFKKKVNEFQARLLEEKMKSMRMKLEEVTSKIRELDELSKNKMQLIDKKGVLKDFKNAVAVYNEKTIEYGKIFSQLQDYENADRQQKILNLKKDQLFVSLDTAIFEVNSKIKDFEKTIIEIHEFIMGSSNASFDIKVVNNTEIIKIEFRIDDDRSHSVDRTKVFIYDLSLIFNHYTRKRHPKFLVHDNIFDVDQDTLVQSLNYLAEQQEKYVDFQYILTLNRDKIENEERKKEIKMDVEKSIVASYTRQSKFLKKNYQEI